MLFVVQPFTFSAMPSTSVQVPAFRPDVTPRSNTGSELQNPPKGLEASIDFYQATGVCLSLEKMWEIFEYAAGGFNQQELYTLSHGLFCGINWEFSGMSLDGMRFAWNLKPDGSVHFWISIPGGCFHMTSLRDAIRTIGGCTKYFGLKPTRIDFKIRDYDKIKTPFQLFKEFEMGNVRGVSCRQFVTSGERGSNDDTIYFGSKESEKRLRVYDANHNHSVDSIDWELQIRKHSAISAVDMLIDAFYNSDDDALALCQSMIGAAVMGLVRFIKDGDTKKGIDTNRCELQDWYEGLRMRAGGALRIPSVRPSTSVLQKMRWLYKQVSTTLACFEEGLGKANFGNWLSNMIEQGRAKIQKGHEALVSQLRRERENLVTS
jgi:hypothetical protein